MVVRRDYETTGLRDYRTTGLPDYRTTGLRDYRTTGPQDHSAAKPAKPQPNVASPAAQPVRTRIKRTVVFCSAVGVLFPLTTLGISPDADISQRSKAATKILFK